MTKDSIVLGSGFLYVASYTGTIPEDTAIETEENRLGYIQGGATLEYTPTFYTAKDDHGIAVKEVITDEEAILKSGIMTWCGKTLQKLCSTARVTEDATNKTRTVKIGGAKNADGANYVVHFVHKDAEDGDVRVTIVGRNQKGFSLAFVKDKETVIDAEFKAKPNDSDGTLIIYKETTEVTAA